MDLFIKQSFHFSTFHLQTKKPSEFWTVKMLSDPFKISLIINIHHFGNVYSYVDHKNDHAKFMNWDIVTVSTPLFRGVAYAKTAQLFEEITSESFLQSWKKCVWWGAQKSPDLYIFKSLDSSFYRFGQTEDKKQKIFCT